MKRWASYVLLLVVVGTALFLGTRGSAGSATPVQRADRIAEEVRCPTCEGLSAAESETPAALAIRKEIHRRISLGESDDDIRSFLVGRYGHDILLRPGSTGVAALVWALPVALSVCAVAGLMLAFRRWRMRAALGTTATVEDRLLVERALRQ